MGMQKAELTKVLSSYFGGIAASNPKVIALNQAFVIELSDRPGFAWTVDYRNMKKGQVSEGASAEAAATFRMPESMLHEVAANPAGARRLLRQALSRQRYEVAGDLEAAQRLRRMLSPEP